MEKTIKEKIVNNLTFHGKNITIEKKLLNSFKQLQKASKKQTKEIVKTAILHSTPIFKIHKLTRKKRKKKKVIEIPYFIKNNQLRVSLALKTINSNLNKKENIANSLANELLLSSQNKSQSTSAKKNAQEKAIPKKYRLRFYKWN